MSQPESQSNRRILIIDDNRAIHEDFRKILIAEKSGSSKVDNFEAALFGDSPAPEDQPAFEIDSAFQGQEGLGLVRQALQENRPYPMAFVDMRMPPGWDGIETITRIWKEYPDLQVVICTAYSDYSWDEMVEKAWAIRTAWFFLKKPFDNIEVLQLTQTLTEKWHVLPRDQTEAYGPRTKTPRTHHRTRGCPGRFPTNLSNASAPRICWSQEILTKPPQRSPRDGSRCNRFWTAGA